MYNLFLCEKPIKISKIFSLCSIVGFNYYRDSMSIKQLKRYNKKKMFGKFLQQNGHRRQISLLFFEKTKLYFHKVHSLTS